MNNTANHLGTSTRCDYSFAQKIINSTLPKLKHKECIFLLEIIENYLITKKYSYSAYDTYSATKDRNNIAYNIIYLFINRNIRELAHDQPTDNKTLIKRILLNLRERLISIINSNKNYISNDNLEIKNRNTIEEAISLTYKTILGRNSSEEEIDIWKNYLSNGHDFHEFFILIQNCEESQQYKKNSEYLPEVSDGKFIQIAYELILSRGAAAWEIDHWRKALEQKLITRAQVILSLFKTANHFFSTQASATPHDGLSCSIMGSGKTVTVGDWHNMREAMNKLKSGQHNPKESSFIHRFHIKKKPGIAVSALASMYRGGDFIEQFMDNITNQEGFDEYCELVIVDADSPEDEHKTIKRYLTKYKNIQYIRCNYRIGIYDAWNVAAKASHGEYLTNTNLDDLRRHDSFALQAAVLDNLSFVDVVYQDLYYTFDPKLSFDEIARYDLKTNLPVITPHNMIQFNSPHNAPMWRKRLHQEIGYFNTHYKSAGDYEFWMRCLAAGKKFYKINDPHVVYYQNPKGLSTRPDTQGIVESMEIHKKYCKILIEDDILLSNNDFLKKIYPKDRYLSNDMRGDRYSLTQDAMRNAARFKKFVNSEGIYK